MCHQNYVDKAMTLFLFVFSYLPFPEEPNNQKHAKNSKFAGWKTNDLEEKRGYSCVLQPSGNFEM